MSTQQFSYSANWGKRKADYSSFETECLMAAKVKNFLESSIINEYDRRIMVCLVLRYIFFDKDLIFGYFFSEISSNQIGATMRNLFDIDRETRFTIQCEIKRRALGLAFHHAYIVSLSYIVIYRVDI